MNKKNILLITAFFYPQNVIASSRVGQWAKYWAKDGNNVIVLTTKKYPFWSLDYEVNLPPDVKIIEIDYLPNFISKRVISSKSKKEKSVKTKKIKASKLLKNKLNYFIDIDIHDLWPFSAIKEGRKIIKNYEINMIISSFSPAASHIIASKLKKENPNITWIADFRDLWFGNHVQSQSAIAQFIRKIREKNSINKADIITTVSQPLSDILKKRYPRKKIVVIENGYDPEEYSSYNKDIIYKPSAENRKFIITYTGMIYSGKRDPSPLFIALNSLIEEDKIKASDVEVEFYGSTRNTLDNIIALGNYNKYGFIKNYEIISRSESIKKQINSNLLLLLEWGNPSANGVLTGKVFEYIASGTPILGVGISKDTTLGKLLESTGTGISTNNIEEIKEIVFSAITQQKFNFYQPNIDQISSYKRDNQSRKILAL